MVFLLNCYLIVILLGSINGYYHFQPPSGPLKGLLPLSYMENYFLVEFSINGGETLPLSKSTDMGHRHFPHPSL